MRAKPKPQSDFQELRIHKERGSPSNQLFDNHDLLTVDEVATLLGKKPQTIRNMVARREIPFIQVRPVRFLRSSIATWLKDKEVKPWQ